MTSRYLERIRAQGNWDDIPLDIGGYMTEVEHATEEDYSQPAVKHVIVPEHQLRLKVMLREWRSPLFIMIDKVAGVEQLKLKIKERFPDKLSKIDHLDLILWKLKKPALEHAYLPGSLANDATLNAIATELPADGTVEDLFPGRIRPGIHIIADHPTAPSKSLPRAVATLSTLKGSRTRDKPVHRRMKALLAPPCDHELAHFALWDMFWPKGGQETELKSILQQGSYLDEEFTYLDLPEQLAVLTKMKTGLLVRNEYERTYGIIENISSSSPYRQGMILTTQRGMGQTSSLYYFLIRRLVQGLPTALQYGSPDFCLLFDSSGTRRIDASGRLDNGPIPSGMWILIDSNDVIGAPTNFFLESPDIFPIQFTPPEHKRWNRWASIYKAGFLTVSPWSEQEMLQLAALKKFGTQKREALISAYRMWGPYPLICMRIARGHLSHEEHEKRLFDVVSINFAKGLDATGNSDFANADYRSEINLVFSLVQNRLSEKSGVTETLHASLVVSTSHIYRLILRVLDSMLPMRRFQLFRVFLRHPSMLRFAASLYRTYVFQHYSADPGLMFHSATGPPEFIKLSGRRMRLSELTSSTVFEEEAFTFAYSDIPSPSAVDGLLISNSRIYVIKSTHGTLNKLDKHEVERLRGTLPLPLLPHRRNWHLVWVVADMDRGAAMLNRATSLLQHLPYLKGVVFHPCQPFAHQCSEMPPDVLETHSFTVENPPPRNEVVLEEATVVNH